MNKKQLQVVGVFIILLGLASVSIMNPVLMMVVQFGEFQVQTENSFESLVVSLGVLFILVAIGLSILVYAQKKAK